MRNHALPLLLLAMMQAGCAGLGVYHPIRMDGLVRPGIRLVTAAGRTLDGPVDVKDAFTVHEKICVYSTFTWAGGSTMAPVEIRLKCYREGVVVYSGVYRGTFDMEPWHVWFDIPSGALGTGKYQADFCLNDAVLDSHAFEITGQ